MHPLPTRRTGSLGPVDSAIHRMRTPPSRLQLRPSNCSSRCPQPSRLPLATESPPPIDQSRRLRMELRLLHQYRPTRRSRKSAGPSLSHSPLGKIPLENRNSIVREEARTKHCTEVLDRAVLTCVKSSPQTSSILARSTAPATPCRLLSPRGTNNRINPIKPQAIKRITPLTIATATQPPG